MSKHTPGPWTWRNEPYDDGKPYIHIEAGDGFHGGNDRGFCFQGIMSEANARLIVSAPELLAALESVLALAVIEYADMSMFDRARAAIAKAKGE